MKTIGDGNSYNWNSWSGDHYKADYEYSEHFWNSLTEPEPNVAPYHQGTHHDEEVIMDMIVHSDFEGISNHQETDIENGIEKYNFEDLASDEENELQVEDAHIEYCYYNTDQLPQTTTTTQVSNYSNNQGHIETDYKDFVKATEEGNWERMKEFLENHPEAVRQKIFHTRKRNALHHAINRGKGWEEIAKCLVRRMTQADLEMKDENKHTSLALAAFCHSSKDLLECIVERNPQLPYKGTLYTIPVIVASYKGFTDTTQYLYQVTHQSFLGPQHHDGYVGLQLLIQCINIKLFDIATELVKNFEGILYQIPPLHARAEAAAAKAAEAAAKGAPDAEAKAKTAVEAKKFADKTETYPIHAFAITFSALLVGIEHTESVGGNFSPFGDCIMTCGRSLLDESTERKTYKADKHKELGHIDEARAFLRLVCDEVSKFDIRKSSRAAYKAMIEAATQGNIKFISEMLKANPNLLSATNGNETMITRAIMNRHEEVFNIVYGAPDYKDELFSVNTEDGNNILHCAAKLPLPSVLDRISSGDPALQMQREIQWFQAVRGEAKDRYREDINNDKMTPRELFIKDHKELAEAGEKSMKSTALAATTVASLIVTTMFGAALAVISGVNQKPAFQKLQTKPLFNTFIVFDALSLFSSTCSILVFLGILASRYSQQDFLRSLPRMFMVGFYTLFCSIATMMAAFGIALVIMLDHGLHFVIVTIFVLSLFPIMFFFISLCPVLCRIRRSTYGPNIFGKSTHVSSTRLKQVDSCF